VKITLRIRSVNPCSIIFSDFDRRIVEIINAIYKAEEQMKVRITEDLEREGDSVVYAYSTKSMALIKIHANSVALLLDDSLEEDTRSE